MIRGYTAGVFDLFHIGHVNLLKRAKANCDHLIVGVSVDELVLYKGKKPVIPFHERIEVVASCRYVDEVVPQTSIDKLTAFQSLRFDKIFVGDDWKGSPEWQEYERRLEIEKVEVVFFPYTTGTSSTLINSTLETLRNRD